MSISPGTHSDIWKFRFSSELKSLFFPGLGQAVLSSVSPTQAEDRNKIALLQICPGFRYFSFDFDWNAYNVFTMYECEGSILEHLIHSASRSDCDVDWHTSTRNGNALIGVGIIAVSCRELSLQQTRNNKFNKFMAGTTHNHQHWRLKQCEFLHSNLSIKNQMVVTSQ